MPDYNSIVEKIRRIYSNPERFIPLHAPVFIGKEKEYLIECIDSTFVSSVGKFVDRFEKDIEKYTRAKKAVVCVNGTNALHLSLQLVGVQQEDEVITQALTFIATANAISYCKAHPVFLDVDRDTLGLSPVAVKKWLEENSFIKDGECYNKITGRRIKACVPMHTFGHPVKLDELIRVCEEYHIELVEDAAEGLGSYYKEKHVGTFGRIGVLSFNGNKTITTGGGGMLLFNDEKLAEHAKHLTTQAKVSHKWEFSHDAIGYNYRMPNLNAALGCAQLEVIEKIIDSKRKIAKEYQLLFEGLDVEFIKEPDGCKANYWLNAVVLKDKFQRDEFLNITNESGIMTRPIWNLMSDLPMFREAQRDSLKVSKWMEERVVNIPSSAKL